MLLIRFKKIIPVMFITWLLSLTGTSKPVYGRVLLQTHGYLTFAPYIHGTVPTLGITPQFRSDYMAYVDLFNWGKLRVHYLLGNSTILGTSTEERFRLDRIRYTLSPGFHYEFRRWFISGSYHHECLHTIDRPEIEYPGFPRGSIWWNTFQMGVGSKGASHLHIREKYLSSGDQFINEWDGQIHVGRFATPEGTANTGRNHNFKTELFGNLRYHIGIYRSWAAFMNLDQHLWWKTDGSNEQKWSLSWNLFRKVGKNFVGFYYT